MPDSCADRGPQVEDGYTRIANELLEALCKWKCRNYEIRLALAIIRLTYGIYGRKSARIENQELSNITAIPENKIPQYRKRLAEMNIINVSTGGLKRGVTYRFNKHYRQWKKHPPEGKTPTGGLDLPADGLNLPTGGNSTLYKENNKKDKRNDGAEKIPRTPPPPYEKIVEYLNALTGSRFNHKNETTRGQIRARFRTGYTEQDFYDVIKVKTDQWLGDPKMTSFLRPDTLFRPTKFDGYLQEARRAKQLGISEKKKKQERRFRIAAAVLRDEGQEACLQYCSLNKVNPEHLKAWMAKQSNEDLLNGS